MKRSTFELGFRDLFRHTVETDGDERRAFIFFIKSVWSSGLCGLQAD